MAARGVIGAGRGRYLAVAALTALTAGGARGAETPAGAIAFARQDGVYLVAPDGTGERRVWRTARAPTGVAWSPHGRRLAVTTRAGLWVVAADGAGVAGLVDRRGPAGVDLVSPSWSPDGRSIAFVAGRGADRDVWSVRVATRALRRVTTTPRHYELDVDWGPSGRLAVTTVYAASSIVGTSDPEASPDVWIVSMSGRYVRNLTPGALRGWEPDWSPDGRRIVLPLWLGADRRTELYVADLAGTRLERLVRVTDDPSDESSPSWSPDGRQIVFVREAKLTSTAPAQRHGGDLHVLDTAGSGLRRLTRGRRDETSPAWRP